MNKRLLSMIMVLSMVFTQLPIPAMAEEAKTPIGASGEIIAFAPPAETEKTVTTGTSAEGLELPETLTATVRTVLLTTGSAPGEPVLDSGSVEDDAEADDLVAATTSSAIEAEASEPRDAGEATGPEWVETTTDIPVTWTSQPEYDMDTGGEYVFTPVIEGYTVSAELPEITVTVGTIEAHVMMLTAGTPIEISNFTNLQSVINNAKNNLDLKLSDSYAESIGTLTIASGNNYNITIDLNGKTLDGGSNSTITHNGGGKLTIIDSSENKVGMVTMTSSSAESQVIFLENESCSLLIDGSRVSVENGYAIFNNTRYAIITVMDGIVESTLGSAIFDRGSASVTISGGTVSGGDDAIFTYTGNVTVSGGIVSSISKLGIYCGSSGTIIIPSGSPIIKGGNMAMSKARDLSSYLDAKVTASINFDGSDPVDTFDPEKIRKYQYIRLDEAEAVKNTYTGAIYHSLQAAVNGLTANNQTLQLLENIELSDALTIANGNDKSFTLDLNDKTLVGNELYPAINHCGSGTLTITDKSNGGNGKITTESRVTIQLDGGKLTVDSGTVENTGSSTSPVSFYTIYNEGTGKITISNTAQILGLSCAIWLNAGIADTTILEISGKMIKSTNGSGIHNNGSGKIVITGGTTVISGDYNAVNTIPDFSGYGDMKVTASFNADGSSPESTFYEPQIQYYLYLKYEPAPVIAEIDGTPYTKLYEAFAAITDNGQTIDLMGNVDTYPLRIESTNDKSFTLNLNSYTIRSDFNVIDHKGSGTLTITDKSAGGGGVVTSSYKKDGTVNLDGGSLVVSGGTVENTGELDSSGSAIYNYGNGSVSVVSNGIVKSIGASAIHNYGVGKITISDNAKVTSAIRFPNNRGTIFLASWMNDEDILLEINGGTIENTANGFAIFSARGKVAITGGTPVIKGGYRAMNIIPDLSYYPNASVIASKFVEGTPRTVYIANIESDIDYYQYLEFGPPVIAAQNLTTGTEYFTVQTAVNEAADGDTIALINDISFVSPLNITLKENARLTIDLRGKAFESSIVYYCQSTGGKLIIDDTVGGGKITSAISDFSSGTIYASGSTPGNAILEIKGSTVENTDNTRLNFAYGGNAICSDNCTVNVTGGTVISSSGGAAIKSCNSGVVNVFSGTLKNTNKYKSTAIYNAGYGTISVSGGTVDGGEGIAIHNENLGIINISGTAMVTGTIGINLLAGVTDRAVLEISGGTVESTKNSGVDENAAIKNYQIGNVRVLGGEVRAIAENGVAVHNIHGGKIQVLGGVVRATAENGIAIYNTGSGSALVFGGTVENTAAGMAIYNTSWSTVEISGGTVCAQNGNAIRNVGKDVLISGGTVSTKVGTAIWAAYVNVSNGTAIIQGGDMAIDPAPELELSIKVTASTNYDGSMPVAVYNPDDIEDYRYLKFEENKDTTVTDLDLTSKLTVPATADTPQAIIIENDQYSGTVQWSSNPTKFLGSTVYTATVTLTAKDGYTFFGVAQNAFTHGSATRITNYKGSRNTLTASVSFPQTAARTLKSIVITTPPNKTAYNYGEIFNKSGMVVKATYNDETEDANFTNYLVDKTGPLTLSDTTITLTVRGMSIQTTQNITVSKKSPTADDLIYDLTAVNYNGIERPISVTAAFDKNLGEITVKYNGGITAPTDAGIYAITVDIAENEEFKAASGLYLGSFSINRIDYLGITTASAEVWSSGQAGVSVSLPTLPAGASYGDPVAGGTIVMTGMGIAGSILTFTAPESTAGQTGTITIPVTGATYYNDYGIVVTVTSKAKAPQVIAYANATIAKIYGDTAFVNPLTQMTVNGTITYTSDDTSVATVNAFTGKVTIVAVGDASATITATAAQTDTHAQATASYTVTVAKKALTLKADNKSMAKGDSLPPFTYTATGLVNGDAVTIPPTMSTIADGIAVGTFDIIISGSVVENAASYAITYEKGTLTVAERLFTVMVKNGTGSASYPEGALVTVTANDKSCYTFIGWSGAGVTFADATAKTTTFTMPANAVTITASYRRNSSGDSSNDNSSPVVVTPPAQDKPNSPTQSEIKVPGAVDGNGNAKVSLTTKTVTDAYNNALAQAKKKGTEQNGITLVLRVDTGSKIVSNVTVNLPKTVQDTIIAKRIVSTIVVVDNPHIRIGMDLTTVKAINSQAKSDVNITATRSDSGKLTGESKNAIGNRPVFDLKVNYGSGKQVQDFGTGSVSVAIPYTLGANEKAGNVQAVYVDANGKVHWITNSVYDSVEKVLRFTTNHFSTYGIGYKQINTAFTDITAQWAKEDIEFAVSRGLISGTSASTFSPNTAMTRGMFVTALGRMANANVSSYKKSSFTDVKNDAYYMGYIEWASKNSIVNGAGNGKFAPDESITREQMAVIMKNYAKAIGFTVPKVYANNTFADNIKISAKDAVKQMQMAGVISVKNGNLFDPQATATRAEISAMLRRFVELEISSNTMQGWTMNDSGQWMYYENGKPVTGKKVIEGAIYTFNQYGVTVDVPQKNRYTTYTVQKGDNL